MNEKEISKFFECFGEIWRNITAIEFLMRCAIIKYDNELSQFPKPPYSRNKIYKNPPDAFLNSSFEIITNKFNKRFPLLSIPNEIIQFRHAITHGVIANINNDKVDQLIKFKKVKNKKEIQVEFQMPLESQKITQIRQSFKELRRYIMDKLNKK